ncbi:MAG: hypothetical protein K2W33_07590, partial [Burkholderiales bacterium]|nr:hypothetical protein [Burkholderiales bacterium]
TGRRHRVIQLPSEMDRIDPSYLPVRIADSVMLQKFLMPLLYRAQETNAATENAIADVPNLHMLDSSFRSAMAYTTGLLGPSAAKRDAVFVVVPNKMIAMSCSPKDARRIRAALASGQKAMRIQSLGEGVRAANDPLNVDIRVHTATKEINKLPAEVAAIFGGVTVVRTGDLLGVEGGGGRRSAKESKASVITMRFETADQAHRIIDLIRMHSGLELYATRPEHKALAREVIRQTMVERREEIERLRVESRLQIESAAQNVPQTPAPDPQDSVTGDEESELAEEAQAAPIPV